MLEIRADGWTIERRSVWQVFAKKLHGVLFWMETTIQLSSFANAKLLKKMIEITANCVSDGWSGSFLLLDCKSVVNWSCRSMEWPSCSWSRSEIRKAELMPMLKGSRFLIRYRLQGITRNVWLHMLAVFRRIENCSWGCPKSPKLFFGKPHPILDQFNIAHTPPKWQTSSRHPRTWLGRFFYKPALLMTRVRREDAWSWIQNRDHDSIRRFSSQSTR